MANNDAPFGLRATRMIGGAPYNGGQSRYRIANNESTSMFQGDLVIQLTAGTIDRFDPSTADALVVGVFMGCRFTDPSTKKKLSKTITRKQRRLISRLLSSMIRMWF